MLPLSIFQTPDGEKTLKLIIAEKPSLARNIVSAIGGLKKYDGFYAGTDYIVTWAFGHLFSLCDVEDYSPAERPEGKVRWSLDNIPCFPEEFRFTLRKDSSGAQDQGVKKQFGVIKSLCERQDVDTIINAGDADREGEIIVRLCINNTAHAGKSLKRLWLPDQTDQTIRAGLASLKDETEYDALADEGFARTYIDWLYGVNLTRFATLKNGNLLRVGRVIVPIVKAVYDRDMAIKNFVPEKYYAILSKEQTDGEEIELLSKEKFSKDKFLAAQNLCDKYNSSDAVVTEVKNKRDKLSAGKLFSLSKLQSYLGKKYKMPMEESLSILQKLYEEGYVTYPRTNSEYLATAEKSKFAQIIANIKKLGYPVKLKEEKNIFDDSKIESHSALTPTYKIPQKNALTEKERQVYSTVFRRFAAVFCEKDCIVNRTEIKIKVGDYEDFSLKGVTMVEKGWTEYDDYSKKDKTLPPLKKGDKINVSFAPTEKETTPPKHYTIETLNNYLKNPFREEKNNIENEDDEEEYRAVFEGLELGTEATRTGIIDNAVKSGYILLKKDVYSILPGGIALIEFLSLLGISMDKYKTSELGKALKKVYHGEMTVKDSVLMAENEIREVFASGTGATGAGRDIGVIGEVVGKCPLCGGEVARNSFGYGCKNYKEKGCRFAFRYSICKRAISVDNAKKLLENGISDKICGFVSKKNTLFDAYLAIEGGEIKFRFDPPPRNNGKDESKNEDQDQKT